MTYLLPHARTRIKRFAPVAPARTVVSETVNAAGDGSVADHVAHVRECVRLACLLEATAVKPGNVHPFASFEDARYEDFVKAADVVAEPLSRTTATSVGRSVLEAVRRTREVASHNVNLGITMLLAPLCAVPSGWSIRAGLPDVLAELDESDAGPLYEAIRLSGAGGLGEVKGGDVRAEPTGSLREMMRLAAERDTIAAEYADGFPLVLDFGLPRLEVLDDFATRWEEHVVRLHLELMARQPDTLIARKCGVATAKESASRAYDVLAAGWPTERLGQTLFRELDDWLRADGHRRNPGTTADLVAACLFVGFRDRLLKPPSELPTFG